MNKFSVLTLPTLVVLTVILKRKTESSLSKYDSKERRTYPN